MTIRPFERPIFEIVRLHSRRCSGIQQENWMNWQIASRRLMPSLLAVTLASALGCANDAPPPPPPGPKGSVTGTVKFDGKPITAGTLLLDSGKGYIAGAVIKPDGTFELKGTDGNAVPAGKYNVAVTPPPAAPPAAGATKMPEPAKIEGVPEKFYNPLTSGVTVEVKEGIQTMDIVLQ